MSIIQQHTESSLTDAWRTINIDALDPDSSQNFPLSTLTPPQPEFSDQDARNLQSQIRQLLQAGDAEGALRSALENPIYNGPDLAKETHLQTVIEVLQRIKVNEMTPLLQKVYQDERGSESLDVLMKYLYKGMAATSGGISSQHTGSGPRTPTKLMTPQATGFSQIGNRPGITSGDSTGAAMSVLLSWHEKVVDVAGLGCIGRVMTDFRRV
ncbi:actin-related protein 2/3 complex subunit 5 [Apiosordaria backusii]|uniref:Actin-related protein 2/3 complex subunit 5 n=1 Tax=Apiosordaria backusii TaxID=314023 RepID=A0AA40EM98_9PEZI|nr:actin-related protein 2/3 complex subunit 5 [Apiosordaria backusii]